MGKAPFIHRRLDMAPCGPKEDPSGSFVNGGWLVAYADADRGQFRTEVTDPADSIAGALNRLPKYVDSPGRYPRRSNW